MNSDTHASPALPPQSGTPANAAPDRRNRSAQLAVLRQELAAPVTAVISLADMLRKDAAKSAPKEFVADLVKIHAAGERLLGLIHDLLDPAKGMPKSDELGRRVRHDLRTPLNHVIGYCDLWLEEGDDSLVSTFLDDLREIKVQGQRTLGLLDELLRVVRVAGLSETMEAPLPEMIRAVAADFQDIAAERAKRTGERGSILIVDDNADNRDLLSRWLRHEGHTVTTAEDGMRALILVHQQPFDLVLLDVIMPGLNGFQVLERLKADETQRHLPVIMVSALDEIDGVVHCIESGAEDYLTKPFNPVLLRARINASLEKKHLHDREILYLQQIRKEQARADELLHVILPTEVVRELKATNTVMPRRYENVAVLFADIVGFTPFCDGHPPEYVVNHLQGLIETWEEIALRHKVEKIKTIGDAFMAAVGLLQKPEDHPVLHAVRCGLEMIKVTRSLSISWDLRVGIHLGPVVAGVIGRRQYLFDLWGDTVNTAARMESHGVPGHVVLSGAAWAPIADRCRGESRGVVSVKGKGQLEMIRFDSFRGE